MPPRAGKGLRVLWRGKGGSRRHGSASASAIATMSATIAMKASNSKSDIRHMLSCSTAATLLPDQPVELALLLPPAGQLERCPSLAGSSPRPSAQGPRAVLRLLVQDLDPRRRHLHALHGSLHGPDEAGIADLQTPPFCGLPKPSRMPTAGRYPAASKTSLGIDALTTSMQPRASSIKCSGTNGSAQGLES